MRKGPRPQSSRTRDLRGNPGKRPINRREPHPPPPAARFDRPPKELARDRVARAEWRRLVPILLAARQITEAERGLLIVACTEYSRYLAAKKLAGSALLVTTSNGNATQHPAGAIAQKTVRLLLQLWNELGLTPSARSRVSTVAPGEAPAVPGDPFAAEFDRTTH